MNEYIGSNEFFVRRGVQANYPNVDLVLISEIFFETNSLVYSAFEPELKYFLFKIKTPTGERYKKHDSGGRGATRISIPAKQLNHVCKQMDKKEIKYMVLDFDRESGANHMKHKIIRSNMCNVEDNLHRF